MWMITHADKDGYICSEEIREIIFTTIQFKKTYKYILPFRPFYVDNIKVPSEYIKNKYISWGQIAARTLRTQIAANEIIVISDLRVQESDLEFFNMIGKLNCKIIFIEGGNHSIDYITKEFKIFNRLNIVFFHGTSISEAHNAIREHKEKIREEIFGSDFPAGLRINYKRQNTFDIPVKTQLPIVPDETDVSTRNEILTKGRVKRRMEETSYKPDVLDLKLRCEFYFHYPIKFTTPSKERTTLFKSLKSKYNANNFDGILQIVKECLPKDAEGNLITEKGKSDVVYDLLVFLNERMIEMNKDKDEGIKGFLEWIEREIGTEIKTLTNKTKLRRYHDLDFDELLTILKKNKRQISVNPSNKEFQTNLEREFEGSTMQLKKRVERIESTDRLINQICEIC